MATATKYFKSLFGMDNASEAEPKEYKEEFEDGVAVPNLISCGWKTNQKFSVEDDPDRTRMHVELPPFLKDKDPHSQRPKLKVDRIKLPWVIEREESWLRQHRQYEQQQQEAEEGAEGTEGGEIKTESKPKTKVYDPGAAPFYYAIVVHNIFTQEECEAIIQMTNTKGYTPALLNIGRGNQQYAPGIRDGWRCIIDSTHFVEYLLTVIEPHLPSTLESATLPKPQEPKRTVNEMGLPLPNFSAFKKCPTLSALNERCRFLCYKPGQAFAPHFDGEYRRPSEHPNFGDRSKITVQLYLNDVPKANGGATTFLDPSQRQRNGVPCQPRAGSALLFTQNLYHEGSDVTGGYKYTIRTEAMYKCN